MLINVHETAKGMELLTCEYITVQISANLTEITGRISRFKLILKTLKGEKNIHMNGALIH
jgi:hypothetical protein